VVAGSGLTSGIPALHGLRPNAQAADFFVARCSAAFSLDPLALAAGADIATQALAWAVPRLAAGPVLVYRHL